MSSFFFDKEKKVLNWLNRFPPELHDFIKEIVIYNALTHPDKVNLLRLPVFEEQTAPAEKVSEPVFIKEETKAVPVKENTPAPPPSFDLSPITEPLKEEDKSNVDSWFNL